jgi:hypothetical protein
MIRTLSRAVSIAKSAIRGPTYGRENGAENHEHYQMSDAMFRFHAGLLRTIIPKKATNNPMTQIAKTARPVLAWVLNPPFFPRLRQNRASFRTVSGKTMLRCRASMSSIYSSRS